MQRIRWIGVLAGILLIAVLAGYGYSLDLKDKEASASRTSSEPVITLRMTYWAGSQLTIDKNTAVIALFEQAYPHIKIEAESISGEAYDDRLIVMAATNSLPDVVRIDYSNMARYAKKNLLLPLDPYIIDQTIDLEGVHPVYNAGAMVNGKQYGLNIGNNALVMFYDKELLEEAKVKPPTSHYSWEQYENDLRAVKNQTGRYGDTHLTQQHFRVWLRSNGVSLYNEAQDGLGYEDDRLWIEFFTRQLRWQREGLLTPLSQELETRNLEDGPFPRGQTAFGGYSYWSNQIDILEKELDKQVGLAPYPGAGGHGMFIKPSFFHSIAKSSKHPYEAALFINFYTNNLDAAKSLNAYFGVPYNPKVIKGLQETFTDTQRNVLAYLSQVEKDGSLIDPPDPIAGPAINQLYKSISNEILFERISPEAGAAKFRMEASAWLEVKSD
ncbi:ABC transporter substrate-binding protein [Paenibacillus sinopodophylli]|uniref:ABC transporter substrate-binding protein n=1 Tax=Paenibacillus sinopodophylli TaxID=1837342 RepID=UPI00110CE025|nr:extracellular solute-binding protein [Paenibacillus sinopodophylli]